MHVMQLRSQHAVTATTPGLHQYEQLISDTFTDISAINQR